MGAGTEVSFDGLKFCQQLNTTFAIATIPKTSTAAFVSPGSPFCLNGPCTGRQYARSAILLVAVRGHGGQTEGLDVPSGQANRDNWLFGMDCLGKQLRGEWKGTDCLEHCVTAWLVTRKTIEREGRMGFRTAVRARSPPRKLIGRRKIFLIGCGRLRCYEH